MAAAWFAAGSLAAGIGVALGAFGAHGLKARVGPEMLAVWETGVWYHLVHALGLLAVSWATERFGGTAPALAGFLFLVGIVVFSGSLYAMTITGARWLGAITPLGGLAFLAGWCALAAAALRR